MGTRLSESCSDKMCDSESLNIFIMATNCTVGAVKPKNENVLKNHLLTSERQRQ